MTEIYHHQHHAHKDIIHSKKWINIIDDFVYVFSSIGLVMTLPQIIKIWVEKNAAGVSALSWIAYLAGALFWTLYGIVHKSKPIALINSIWVVLDVIIIIGTFTYGGGL